MSDMEMEVKEQSKQIQIELLLKRLPDAFREFGLLYEDGELLQQHFAALEAKLSKMEEAKIRIGIDDEYVHGSVFHMERMDSDHIWFRIGEQAFDLYAKRHGKLLWIPQIPNGSWEALAGSEEA